jgi:predicted phosphohydrolase
MLDKKVFAREIERLMQFYPTWVIKYDDKVTMENWYKIFEDYKDDEFENTVTNFIKTIKFNPTVAGLIELKPKQQYTGFNDYYDDGED